MIVNRRLGHTAGHAVAPTIEIANLVARLLPAVVAGHLRGMATADKHRSRPNRIADCRAEARTVTLCRPSSA